jgi:ligand-binding sensor protein
MGHAGIGLSVICASSSRKWGLENVKVQKPFTPVAKAGCHAQIMGKLLDHLAQTQVAVLVLS